MLLVLNNRALVSALALGVASLAVLKFYVEVIYLMGKALIGELSCTWTVLVEVFAYEHLGKRYIT